MIVIVGVVDDLSLVVVVCIDDRSIASICNNICRRTSVICVANHVAIAVARIGRR